jgi:hypothetical protein
MRDAIAHMSRYFGARRVEDLLDKFSSVFLYR